MTCRDCDLAAKQPHHGFTADCLGCKARAAARSPQYREAKIAGKLTPKYKALLTQFELTHEQVKDAADRDHQPQA